MPVSWPSEKYSWTALADLQNLLARPVAAHFGRGGMNAQELARQVERPAVSVGDFQRAGFLMQLYFSRRRRVPVGDSHGPHALAGIAGYA